MKIFFSYAHDENAFIVEQLKHDVEEYTGYEIWIDTHKLKNGDDWRAYIREGIASSDLVVSFASEKSTNPGGVCLDELKIACFEKGSVIQTIVLEKDIDIPKNISFMQYIDMSDWRSEKTAGTYEEWYKQKLQEVIHAINHPDIPQFAEDMEELRLKFKPDLSNMKKEHLQAEEYFGRKWLSGLVREWQKQDDNHVLLITGFPGIGKSSFIAHEFMYDEMVDAVIFCQYNNEFMNNHDSITRNLIYQFARHDAEYRKRVMALIHEDEDRVNLRGKALYDTFITGIVSTLIDGKRPTVYILVDGLDELKKDTDAYVNPIADRLREACSPDMPHWLRYIATTRPDPSVLEPLANASRIVLDDYKEENAEDVRNYIELRMKDHLQDYAIAMLVQKAEGNFLYAATVCKGLLAGKLTLEDISTSTGMEGIYYQYFVRLFGDKKAYAEKYSAISAVTYSPSPVPENTLKRGIGTWSVMDLNTFKDDLSQFLVINDHRIAWFHKSIIDWLTGENAGSFEADKEEAMRVLAEGCYESYRSNPQKMNEYEYLNLIEFLKKSNSEKLMEVLQDLSYGMLLLDKAKEAMSSYQFEKGEKYCTDAIEILNMQENQEEISGLLYEACELLLNFHDRSNELETAIACSADAIRALEGICPEGERSRELQTYIANLYNMRGIALRQLDKYIEATEASEKAAAIFHELNEPEREIESLLRTAQAWRMEFKYDNAEKVLGRIFDNPVFTEMQDSNYEQYFDVKLVEAFVYFSAGKKDRQEEVVQCCWEMIAEHPDLLSDYERKGAFYYQDCLNAYTHGKYEECIRSADTSIENLLLAYGPGTREITSPLNQKGNAYLHKKEPDCDIAIACFRESVDIRMKTLGKVNTMTATSMRNLGRGLISKGTPEALKEAEGILLDTLKVRKILGKGSYIGMAYVDLAEYAEKMENYRDAVEYMEHALKWYEEDGSEKDFCKCYDYYGRSLYNLGEYEKAEEPLRKALVLQKVHFKDGVDPTKERLAFIEEWKKENVKTKRV